MSQILKLSCSRFVLKLFSFWVTLLGQIFLDLVALCIVNNLLTPCCSFASSWASFPVLCPWLISFWTFWTFANNPPSTSYSELAPVASRYSSLAGYLHATARHSRRRRGSWAILCLAWPHHHCQGSLCSDRGFCSLCHWQLQPLSWSLFIPLVWSLSCLLLLVLLSCPALVLGRQSLAKPGTRLRRSLASSCCIKACGSIHFRHRVSRGLGWLASGLVLWLLVVSLLQTGAPWTFWPAASLPTPTSGLWVGSRTTTPKKLGNDVLGSAGLYDRPRLGETFTCSRFYSTLCARRGSRRCGRSCGSGSHASVWRSSTCSSSFIFPRGPTSARQFWRRRSCFWTVYNHRGAGCGRRWRYHFQKTGTSVEVVIIDCHASVVGQMRFLDGTEVALHHFDEDDPISLNRCPCPQGDRMDFFGKCRQGGFLLSWVLLVLQGPSHKPKRATTAALTESVDALLHRFECPDECLQSWEDLLWTLYLFPQLRRAAGAKTDTWVSIIMVLPLPLGESLGLPQASLETLIHSPGLRTEDSWAGGLRIGEVFLARRSDLVLPADAAPGTSFILLRIRTPKTRGRSAQHQAARVDPADFVVLIAKVLQHAEISHYGLIQLPHCGNVLRLCWRLWSFKPFHPGLLEAGRYPDGGQWSWPVVEVDGYHWEQWRYICKKFWWRPM